MASHHGAGGNSSDNVLAAMLVMIALMVFIWIAKPHAWHAYYTSAYYQYRGLEYVLPEAAIEATGVRESRRAIANSLNLGVGKYDPNKLTNHLFTAKIFYGSLVLIFLLWLGYRIWRDKPDNYTTKLSMEDMELHLLAKYWQNAPVIGRHLDRRHPLKDKEWRYSRKPWEFAYEFGIVTNGEGQTLPIRYEQQEVYMIKPTNDELEDRIFNTKRAESVFAKQLGERIEIKTVKDILRLPNEHKALIVPMLCDIDGFYQDKVGQSDKWLKQYALSFLDPALVMKSIFNRDLVKQLPPFKRETLNMEGVDEALRVAFQIPTAKAHLLNAAYSNTLLVQLMNKTIVMKSAYFKWLKPMNRDLWYGMNNVGKPGTAHVEGAGLSVHTEYELKAERKEYVPQVSRAVQGLRAKLKEYYFLNS